MHRDRSSSMKIDQLNCQHTLDRPASGAASVMTFFSQQRHHRERHNARAVLVLYYTQLMVLENYRPNGYHSKIYKHNTMTTQYKIEFPFHIICDVSFDAMDKSSEILYIGCCTLPSIQTHIYLELNLKCTNQIQPANSISSKYNLYVHFLIYV